MNLKRLSCPLAVAAALAGPAAASHIPPGTSAAPGVADELLVFIGPGLFFGLSVPEGGPEVITTPPIPNVGVTPGTYIAWMLEPGTLLVSDQITAAVDPASIFITFASDPLVPATPCPGAPTSCVVEDGFLQDMTAALFGLITAPLEVYAFSDVDADTDRVPEPGSLALLGLGLAGLGWSRRR